MKQIFHRQLAAYAQYHRDPHNCLTHFIGMDDVYHTLIGPMFVVAKMLVWLGLRRYLG
jgi:uncharacterized membrane protein YGL010W